MKVEIVEVKLGEIEQVETALAALAKVSIPAREAWAIAKVLRAVKTEAEDFRKERNKLLERLGKTSNGYSFDIPPENIKEFNDSIRSLTEVEVGVPFPQVEFKVFENAKLTPEVIEPLIAYMFPDMEGREL